jgi:uncharacterized protein YdaU (DUF1376 family)
MSNDAPAIPLFGDAYLADTRHLSLEEHGAYLQLLMIAWRLPNCALPDDDARIARILGITAGRWSKLKPAVLGFWTSTDKGWVQGRLSKERAFVEKKREQNSAASKARWDAQATDLNKNDASERISERNAPPPPPPEDKQEVEEQAAPAARAMPVHLPVEEAVEDWNVASSRTGWPAVQRMSDTRRQAVRNRLRKEGLDGWRQAIAKAEASPYLGGSPPAWFTFDWIIKQANFDKLIEGNYDRTHVANDRSDPDGLGINARAAIAVFGAPH